MKTYLMALGAPCVAAMRLTTRALNPARRIITALEQMLQQGNDEFAAAQDLYDKFLCQWKKETAENTECVDTATATVDAQDAKHKAADSRAKVLLQEIEQHTKDRDEAESSLEQADKIREKEQAEFTKLSADLNANIEGIGKAVIALRTGTTSLLQTPQKSTIVSLLDSYSFDDMDNFDLQLLTNFLQGTSTMEAGSSSGEIIGILETMGGQMQKDLEEATNDENNAVTSFDELGSAKRTEIAAASKAIEDKGMRQGEQKVAAVQAKGLVKSSTTELEECQATLADLAKSEAEKTAAHTQLSKDHADENVAIQEATSILNSDEARAAFGKIGDGGKRAESFLQVSAVHKNSLRASAVLKKAAVENNDSRLGFLAMALKGQKSGFDKINKMIDDMGELLKAEQAQEVKTNEKCKLDLLENDQEKKTTAGAIGASEAKQAAHEETVESMADTIEAKKKAVATLDENTATNTEGRKAENALYLQTKQEQMGAQKFLKQAEGIIKKKLGEKGANVLLLFQKLDSEINQEISTLDTEEKNDQAEYEKLVAKAAETRKTYNSEIVSEQTAKADEESNLQSVKTTLGEQNIALLDVSKILLNLHGSCDFLLKNFDERQDARTNEMEGLKRAKAVLAGADY